VSREDYWIEPEEAGLRLLLFAGDVAAPDDELAAAIAAAPVAAVIVRPSAIDAWMPACRRASCALLCDGDLDAALAHGADGVHLHSLEHVAMARRRVGDGRLLGVTVGRSRHAAMVAGEAGADYVLLGPARPDGDAERLADAVAWWGELFVLPCGAGPVADDAVAMLARAGLDFLVAELGGSDRARRVGELARLIASVRKPG
jgi:thiamine-phosphate pyrophosphorylase